MKVCPTCQRPIPPPFWVGGPRRQKMVDYIAKHPEGVTVWQIIAHVYADDPNGGPTDHNVIPVMKNQANKILVKEGWKIVSPGGPGSLYKLVPL